MNYTIFFYLLNLILISRLRFTMRDEGISGRKDILWLTVIPLLVFPFLSFNLSPDYSPRNLDVCKATRKWWRKRT